MAVSPGGGQGGSGGSGQRGGAADFRLLAQAPLGWRLTALFVGLAFYGLSSGLMVMSNLGPVPWDVLHQGISHHVPLSIGTIIVIMSLIVLLAWIPLKQKPGLGTFANAILVGVWLDFFVWLIGYPEQMWVRILFMISGIVLNAIATVLYIIPNFGPGPRDGLMTGLTRVTGKPVWMVRSVIEVLVLVTGVLLGGLLWIGTFAYASLIGPLTNFFLRVAQRIFGPSDPLVSDET